ncbi:CSR-1 protein [Aphelenchoides avenae]|nr:CSR-1 protein [Aphelenchus avenae]
MGREQDFTRLPAEVQKFLPNSDVRVEITANQMQPELDLTDFEQYVNGRSLFNEERSMRMFLDIALAQEPVNRGFYKMIGAGKLYATADNQAIMHVDRNRRPVDGVYLRPGVAKGVKVVRNYGNPTPALVLDAKYSPFFKSQKLIETVLEIAPDLRNNGNVNNPRLWEKVSRMLEGVRVYSTRNPKRSFRIDGLSREPVGRITFEHGELGEITVADYYRGKGVNPREDFPGIYADLPTEKGAKRAVYAIEDLFILPDQRVPVEKIKYSDGLQKLILDTTTKDAHTRMQRVLQHAETLGVFRSDNATLRAFGIRVDPRSNKIAIGVRKLPPLQPGGNGPLIHPDPEKGNFPAILRAQYLRTKEIKNWVAIFNVEKGLSGNAKRLVEQFIEKAIAKLRQKGVKIDQPVRVIDLRSDYAAPHWPGCFTQLKEKKIQFVLYFDSLNDKTSHATLKFCETYYKVLTQHVTLDRAEDVVAKGKNVTLENILLKTNNKNGGLTYAPVLKEEAKRMDLEEGAVMVIGYDVAHPRPLMAGHKWQMRDMLRKAAEKGAVDADEFRSVDNYEPSVVGISGNVGSHPYMFHGDYFYQKSRSEAVDERLLAESMKTLLETLKKNRPKHSEPKIIVVCRDGLSEGQFKMAAEDELRALRNGCQQYNAGYMPMFVFVVGTKRHFKRLFAERDGKICNLLPGSVVDGSLQKDGCLGVDRPDCPEFYMVPHAPVRAASTVSSVQFAVLANDTNKLPPAQRMTKDELQALLLALCYDHQISVCGVSIPEPTFRADELAKRGFNNFAEMKRLMPDRIPKMAELPQFVDARALTNQLRYTGSHLASNNFTA